MMNKKVLNHIRSFGMSGFLLSEDLHELEQNLNLKFGHTSSKSQEEESKYYPQFQQAIRAEAGRMSQYYELFYCLETSIRKLISDTLEEAESANWWDSDKVSPHIREEVKKRVQREIDSGVTRRSDAPIDYTTFGELSVIITSNWNVFGGTIFNSKRAVERVMSSLNLLRGPIAHCCPITEDEIDRLHLTVKDWFRTMT